MISTELRFLIAELMNEYAHALDDDRLESWPEFFTEDGVYQIVPRENVQQGLPGVIAVCYGRNMMHDRIKVLREANEFNIHTDRHVVAMPWLKESADGALHASSSYALFQTDQEGESRLFSVGRYDDVIQVVDGKPKFRERTVIVDTYAIPNLLATPI
jgi:anthranilate 1,2-dioxygenase small subunit